MKGGIPVPDDILLVDDDPRSIQILARILAQTGELRFATDGHEALRQARRSTPDLVLLDANMPGLGGFEVCAAMRADPALGDVPIIFVTNHSDVGFELSAFEAGAVDFITKPVSAPVVLARVQTQLRVKRLTDELRRTATTDGLTGVANRRQFDEVLGREWLRARRAGDPLALLMVDVDHFKLYNDRYGHPAGDACLRKVARALVSASLRPGDLVARYGGEEFVLLLPQTPRGGAEKMALRVLDAVAALAIPHEASQTARHLSTSIGIGCYDDQSECWATGSADSRFDDQPHANCNADDLLRAADKALYAAKHAGRAQTRLLDIAEVDSPRAASAITAQWRKSRGAA